MHRDTYPISSPVDDERVGAAMRVIFERDHTATLIISGYDDEGTPGVSITAIIEKKQIIADQESIVSALHHINGFVATKLCMGPCGVPKPLSHFSRNRAKQDGFSTRCKECERQRMAAIRESRRAARTEPTVLTPAQQRQAKGYIASPKPKGRKISLTNRPASEPRPEAATGPNIAGTPTPETGAGASG